MHQQHHDYRREPETLHPVVLAVPQAGRQLKGREKVAVLRRRAREALALSAGYSGVRMGPLEKDGNGAPLPSNGVHWSLTHKEDFVAAVTASRPVGIDIEKIKAVNPALSRRIACEQEWALASTMSEILFFRYWTAKEAVLKAVGKGFAGLSRCRIQAIVDGDRLILGYGKSTWTVVQYWGTKDHVVALTADHSRIQWHQID